MSCYKALISKKGEILSLSEQGEDSDKPCMDVATGSQYPDAVFVNATGSDEAEQKVQSMLRKAEEQHLQHADPH